ncbi:hypothetical protein SHJG_5772 [Streptomyces hygroscopicus subsp. jinggangensis 5008]|nr:hypothetical protein SHJG_5772 [Streptomyces hygroscopicus subsp. jinggangensis 5008]AGF65196.1 hypothetical protein SHJGH_5533 [Streptomyces hygroscopicus subsp. jinggangensis TL01]
MPAAGRIGQGRERPQVRRAPFAGTVPVRPRPAASAKRVVVSADTCR